MKLLVGTKKRHKILQCKVPSIPISMVGCGGTDNSKFRNSCHSLMTDVSTECCLYSQSTQKYMDDGQHVKTLVLC